MNILVTICSIQVESKVSMHPVKTLIDEYKQIKVKETF